MNVKDQIIEQIYSIRSSEREPVHIELSPPDYDALRYEAQFSEMTISANLPDEFMGLPIAVKAPGHKLTVTSRGALRERERG
mgnify:CR=1 FL=1